jgi:hypothetical protein
MVNNWRVQQPAELVDAEVVTEGGRMCNTRVRNRQRGDACKADLLGGDEGEECRDGRIGESAKNARFFSKKAKTLYGRGIGPLLMRE